MKITRQQLKKIIESIVQTGAPGPVKIDRQEYIHNRVQRDWVEEDELRRALANTSMRGLRVVGASSPSAVADFTYHPVGDKALPLEHGANGEIYFKVNDSAAGTYYKI